MKSNIGVYLCRKCQSVVPDNQGRDMKNNVYMIRIMFTYIVITTKRHIQNCVGKQKKTAEEFKTCIKQYISVKPAIRFFQEEGV